MTGPRLVMRRILAGLAFGVSAAGVVWWESSQAPFEGATPALALGVLLLCLAALGERSRILGAALAPPAFILGAAMLIMECGDCLSADTLREQATMKDAMSAAMVCALAVAVQFMRGVRSRKLVYIGHFFAFVGIGLAAEALIFALFDPALGSSTPGILVPASGLALGLALMTERPHRGLRWLFAGHDPMGLQMRRYIWSVVSVVPLMGGGYVVHAYTRHEAHFAGDMVVLFSLIVWQVVLLSGLGAVRLEQIARKQRRAEARMERMAMSDGLTGLANRTAFERRLSEVAEAARDGVRTFTLVIFDVDHFKVVNDTYGHAAGDGVLRALGECLRAYVGKGAFVARLGGEEFAMIVDGMAEDVAQSVQELRRRIEQCRFSTGGEAMGDEELEGEEAIRVTASFGVSDFCPRDTLNDIYARVDRALYRAKARGRNQVAVIPRAVGGCNLDEQRRNLAAGLCGEGKCGYLRD